MTQRGRARGARLTLSTAGAVLAVAAALGASAPARAADADGHDAAERGRSIYMMSCQRCHGINLVSNGIGFDLRTFPQSDKSRFIRSVTHGLRAMPAWGETLKRDQLDLIWAYIGSVNGWKAPAAPQ
jgi:cytochrome c55X